MCCAGSIQFQSARAFVKNVTELFGKTDGQRSKCPRCKGSGLFASQSFWRWGQPSRTNSPCWFCEGYASPFRHNVLVGHSVRFCLLFSFRTTLVLFTYVSVVLICCSKRNLFDMNVLLTCAVSWCSFTDVDSACFYGTGWG